MEKSNLPSKAKEILKYFLDSYGEVIYSSHETLKQGDIYLMGLNPGGGGHTKLGEHIDKMLTRTDNSYTDEAWTNRKTTHRKGEAPLQERVKGLIGSLGYNIEKVCSTNLIFTTSRSSNELCFGIAGICWAFHEILLDIVKPKIIITFGNSETSASPYFFLKSLFKGEEMKIPSGYGDWTCKGFNTTINGRDTFIVGLPHLSYYNPKGKNHVIKWIKDNGKI